MVAADPPIQKYVLNESKHRADQRHANFQSTLERFPVRLPRANRASSTICALLIQLGAANTQFLFLTSPLLPKPHSILYVPTAGSLDG